MTRIQFPHKSFALTVSFSVKPPNLSLFYRVSQLHHDCRVDIEENVQDVKRKFFFNISQKRWFSIFGCFLFYVNKGKVVAVPRTQPLPALHLMSLIKYVFLPIILFQGEAYCICNSEDAVIVRITSLEHSLPRTSLHSPSSDIIERQPHRYPASLSMRSCRISSS